jgi:SAM-dependent methyltransferase
MCLRRSILLPLLMGGLLAGSLVPLPAPAQFPDSLDSPFLKPPALPTATDTAMRAEVPFVRTPKKVVVRMLELADVGPDDLVYDLGSGDGRIPITAAQQFGARGVGIEIQPNLVQKARSRAEIAGVADRVEFRQGDLFKADFSDATVVTLYLLPDVNTRLRPRLFDQLAPGTRVVSHGFDMDAWAPDTTATVGETRVYLWTIPEEIPPHLKD